VVPESPEAQDASAEEPEQQQVEEDEHGDDEEYSPLSVSENEKLYHDIDERESYRVEDPVPIGRLQALLVHLGITTAPKYWIKGVPRPGRVEYQTIADIFSRFRVISRHRGPAFRASSSDAVADTTWQGITSWSHRHQDKLQDSVCRLIPQRKKDQFKAPGVKKV
jgi:hypothetical protein